MIARGLSTAAAIIWAFSLAGSLDGMEFEAQGRVCAGLAVYTEARGEPWAGQQMVAQVLANRARISGGDLCSVALAPNQFQGISKSPTRPWLRDPKGWDIAMDAVDSVLLGWGEPAEDCRDAIAFQTSELPPPKGHTLACTIANHSFYRKP